MSLAELVEVLQDLGILVAIVLIAYLIYKIGILVEAITEKLKES